MAVPLVSGSLGLLASEYPNETLTDRLTRIILTGDSLPSLAGKCRTGKRLDVNNALNLAKLSPYITSLSKTEELVPGTVITINGLHFGQTPGNVIFIINSSRYYPELISWSDTQVVCKAPYTPHNLYALSVENATAVPSFNQITVSSWPAASQTLLAEDFEGTFPPSGWTVQDNFGSDLVWQRNDRVGSENNSGGSGYCATANSDKLNTNGQALDTELRSPVINLQNHYDHVELSFQHHYADAYTYASVDISITSAGFWASSAGRLSRLSSTTSRPLPAQNCTQVLWPQSRHLDRR